MKQCAIYVQSPGNYVYDRSTCQRSATEPKRKNSVRAAHMFLIWPKMNFLFYSEKLLSGENVSGCVLCGTTDVPPPHPSHVSGSCDQHIMIGGRVDKG